MNDMWRATKSSSSGNRMTNILMAGNLYKTHKIGKQLGELSALHKISMGVAINNLEVNLGVLKNLKKKEAEEKKTKLLKDIFFQISEEFEEIQSKKSYPLEKYFLLSSLKVEIEKNEIDTSLAEDLTEKKLISSTIKNLTKMVDTLNKKFNKKEKADKEEILKILEVDEESQIDSINSSSAGIISGCVSGFEKYLTYIKKFQKGDGHSQNSKLVEFFESFRNPISIKHLTALKGSTGWGDALKGYYGEKQSRDSVNIITPNSMLHLYKGHQNSKSKRPLEGVLDFVEGNKHRPTVTVFWNEIFKNIHENLTTKEIEKILKLKKVKDFFIPAWSLTFRKKKKESEKKDGQELNDEIIDEEVYYIKNKVVIDGFYNIVLKSLKNSFKDVKRIRSKDLKTVKKLKGDIQKEKGIVKQIRKKHKFVEKIIASRI